MSGAQALLLALMMFTAGVSAAAVVAARLPRCRCSEQDDH